MGTLLEYLLVQTQSQASTSSFLGQGLSTAGKAPRPTLAHAGFVVWREIWIQLYYPLHLGGE